MPGQARLTERVDAVLVDLLDVREVLDAHVAVVDAGPETVIVEGLLAFSQSVTRVVHPAVTEVQSTQEAGLLIYDDHLLMMTPEEGGQDVLGMTDDDYVLMQGHQVFLGVLAVDGQGDARGIPDDYPHLHLFLGHPGQHSVQTAVLVVSPSDRPLQVHLRTDPPASDEDFVPSGQETVTHVGEVVLAVDVHLAVPLVPDGGVAEMALQVGVDGLATGLADGVQDVIELEQTQGGQGQSSLGVLQPNLTGVITPFPVVLHHELLVKEQVLP